MIGSSIAAMATKVHTPARPDRRKPGSTGSRSGGEMGVTAGITTRDQHGWRRLTRPQLGRNYGRIRGETKAVEEWKAWRSGRKDPPSRRASPRRGRIPAAHEQAVTQAVMLSRYQKGDRTNAT